MDMSTTLRERKVSTSVVRNPNAVLSVISGIMSVSDWDISPVVRTKVGGVVVRNVGVACLKHRKNRFEAACLKHCKTLGSVRQPPLW